jgi:biotin synthase
MAAQTTTNESGRDFGSLLCEREGRQELRTKARALRDSVFGNRVFVRGVLEVSNYCRQNCHYCAMRRDNRDLKRYRLVADELLELLLHHAPASITDIDIQAGEDPVVVREVVTPLVREICRHTNLGVTLCLGTLSPREYDALRECGADYYVLKLETGDAGHYASLRAPGTLSQRIEAIRHLASTGWKVSSGFIVGLPGQTGEEVLRTLELLTTLPLAGCSVSPFISGPQTPLANEPNGSIELTLDCVAWMRRAVAHWIIPAVSAMGLVSDDGYVRALESGANLATINLTPPGPRSDYPIYRRNRTIMDEERVMAAIERAGCLPSRVGVSESLRQGAVAAVS